MQTYRNPRIDERSRRGTVFPVFVVALIVTATVIGTLVSSAMLERKQVLLNGKMNQAEWLALSALDRASKRLAAETTYSGEVWNVPTEDLDGSADASIEIKVADYEENGKKITVQVQWSAGDDLTRQNSPVDRIQLTRHRIVTTEN